MSRNRVIRLYQQGDPSVLRLEETVPPEAGPGEVVLAQEAVGINFVDVLYRTGRFSLAAFPAVIGNEAAGVVTGVGPRVTDWRVGDRAGYWTTLGAYAESRVIAAHELVPIPADLPGVVAASLLAKGLTAWVFTQQVHPVTSGQTVVVNPAAGATGFLMIRWARAIGARVIAVVGSEGKADAVRAGGFDDVVVAGTPDWTASEVLRVAGGARVEAVYDGVGGDGFVPLARLVATGGSAVLTGFAAGMPVVSQEEFAGRNVRFFPVPPVQSYVTTPQIARSGTDAVFAAYAAGVFGDVEPTNYAFEDVVRLHDDLEQRRTTGPLVLLP